MAVVPARSVTVKSIGSTDNYKDAEVNILPSGDLVVTTKNTRTWKTTTYARGRWTNVQQEGRMQNGE